MSQSKRVLVTGAAGMLGSQVLLSAPDGVRTIGTDLVDGVGVDEVGVDLADERAVGELFERLGELTGVIHTAAYTAVDRAEEEEELKQQAKLMDEEERRLEEQLKKVEQARKASA